MEMTSLILRLPEVESLLQRAGLNTNIAVQDPKTALTLFIKVHKISHTHIITVILFITGLNFLNVCL